MMCVNDDRKLFNLQSVAWQTTWVYFEVLMRNLRQFSWEFRWC